MSTLIENKNLASKEQDITLSAYQKMIYDLLFSKNTIHNIPLEEFCSFEYRPIFRDEIRKIVTKGGIKILDDRIIHTNESVIWKLELKK